MLKKSNSAVLSETRRQLDAQQDEDGDVSDSRRTFACSLVACSLPSIGPRSLSGSVITFAVVDLAGAIMVIIVQLVAHYPLDLTAVASSGRYGDFPEKNLPFQEVGAG